MVARAAAARASAERLAARNKYKALSAAAAAIGAMPADLAAAGVGVGGRR